MDIYGMSDCKIGPPEPPKSFDAEKFARENIHPARYEHFSERDRQLVSALSQAAHDQGRADVLQEQENDMRKRFNAAVNRLNEIEKEQQARWRKEDPCEK